jgi:hypothetical protein
MPTQPDAGVDRLHPHGWFPGRAAARDGAATSHRSKRWRRAARRQGGNSVVVVRRVPASTARRGTNALGDPARARITASSAPVRRPSLPAAPSAHTAPVPDGDAGPRVIGWVVAHHDLTGGDRLARRHELGGRQRRGHVAVGALAHRADDEGRVEFQGHTARSAYGASRCATPTPTTTSSLTSATRIGADRSGTAHDRVHPFGWARPSAEVVVSVAVPGPDARPPGGPMAHGGGPRRHRGRAIWSVGLGATSCWGPLRPPARWRPVCRWSLLGTPWDERAARRGSNGHGGDWGPLPTERATRPSSAPQSRPPTIAAAPARHGDGVVVVNGGRQPTEEVGAWMSTTSIPRPR